MEVVVEAVVEVVVENVLDVIKFYEISQKFLIETEILHSFSLKTIFTTNEVCWSSRNKV